ncbi:hypothetical protein IGI04_022942 [Brassica rapa subsp. trilocularis]|uniref:Uncharacterized protein n=1 Tax=Brassica rapa subsp. trilocularis TaxID=1813537 RepID=A0ABQ7M2F7_BRACM|nr:hypothetical protein IGI04_022942 [Brassica rapa subsp. trilocularis]
MNEPRLTQCSTARFFVIVIFTKNTFRKNVHINGYFDVNFIVSVLDPNSNLRRLSPTVRRLPPRVRKTYMEFFWRTTSLRLSGIGRPPEKSSLKNIHKINCKTNLCINQKTSTSEITFLPSPYTQNFTTKVIHLLMTKNHELEWFYESYKV